MRVPRHRSDLWRTAPESGAAAAEVTHESLREALAQTEGELRDAQDEIARLAAQLDQVERRQQSVAHHAQALAARVAALESARGLGSFVHGVRRAVARRRFEFDAVPAKEAVKIPTTPDAWESAGSEPSLTLRPRGGAFPTGWVVLELELDVEGPCDLPPRLYVDRGEGYTEASSFRLPFADHGRVVAVFKLLGRVAGLRLDPLDRCGRFRLGRIVMQEVGRPEMGIRLVAPRVMGLLREPSRIPAALARIATAVRAGGVQQVKDHLVGKAPVEGVDYADWVERFQALHDADRAAIVRRIEALARRPRFSIVMRVYDTPERWLERALESVRGQLYPDWELCIADDASTASHVARVLDAHARSDPRIKVVHRNENDHIAASNSALAMATGEFVALLDSDDELTPHALYMVAEELGAHPDADLVYSDEDEIDEEGRQSMPYFKPDWNPDLFFSRNYFCHLGVYRTELVRAVGGFRAVMDGSQDYDLALRCVARTRADRIRHVPHVLYHWRMIAGSGAMDPRAKRYAEAAGERALREHFVTVDPRIDVSVARFPNTYRVRYPLPSDPPLVSIIIPTRDARTVLERCIESICTKTTYPRFELVVVDNGSRDPAALDYLDELARRPQASVIRWDRPFNYSAMNNLGVRESSGDVLALLNNDVEVISPDWLTEMVSHALRPEVGAVGAKLLYPTERVQHAGIVIGLVGLAGHIHVDLPRDAAGYFCRAAVTQAISAVTGACLVIRRSVYEEMDGLDEHLTIAFNDVDFCLRVDAAGYRNLWTPFAELYHHESLSRGPDDTPEKRVRFQREVEYMRSRWGQRLRQDRYHSPNLSYSSAVPQLAWPPRVRAPWREPGARLDR